MPDISDEYTYACDREDCQVPVVLSALVRVGREHWCRSCLERHGVTGSKPDDSTVFEDWPGQRHDDQL